MEQSVKLEVLQGEVTTGEQMTDAEFHEKMETGLKQAKDGNAVSVDEAFDQILKRMQ